MSQDGDDKKPDDKKPSLAEKLAAADAEVKAEAQAKAEAKQPEDAPAAAEAAKPAPKAEKPADAVVVDEKPAAKAAATVKAADAVDDKQPAAKPADKKPDDKKPADKQPDDKKPADKKADDKQPDDKKPDDAKAAAKPAAAKAVEPPAKSDGVVRQRANVPPTRKNEAVREPTVANVAVPITVPITALVGFALIVVGSLYGYFLYDVGWHTPQPIVSVLPGPPQSIDITVKMVSNSAGSTIVQSLLALAPMLFGLALFARGLREDGRRAPHGDPKIDVPIQIPIGMIVLVLGGMIMFLGHESGLLDGAAMHVIVGGLPIAAGTLVFCLGLQKLRRTDKPPPNPDEPPVRQSYHDMMNPVMTYPDGKLSAVMRSADLGLGRAEQVVLVSLLTIVTFVAATHAIADKVANIAPFGHFKDDAIRAGTFAIALIGGAFATHQVRHLAMDLITRGLPPRSRLILKVVIAAFTVFVIVTLVRSGFHSIWREYEFKQDADKLITPVRVAYLIPIGGGLVILHTILHTIIDIDYLARGKLPPERARSGH